MMTSMAAVAANEETTDTSSVGYESSGEGCFMSIRNESAEQRAFPSKWLRESSVWPNPAARVRFK